MIELIKFFPFIRKEKYQAVKNQLDDNQGELASEIANQSSYKKKKNKEIARQRQKQRAYKKVCDSLLAENDRLKAEIEEARLQIKRTDKTIMDIHIQLLRDGK